MTIALHLEADASLNRARVRGAEDGRQTWFAGGGIVLRTSKMEPVHWAAVPLGYVRSVEEAECLALVEGASEARSRLSATRLRARTDNLSLVRHAGREALSKEPGVAAALERLWSEIEHFSEFKLLWAPASHQWVRADGAPTADALARAAAGLGARKVRSAARQASANVAALRDLAHASAARSTPRAEQTPLKW